MEKIIQLKEREYNELCDKANMTQDSIDEAAEKLYQEKGTYEIRLTVDTDYSYNQLSFKSNSWENNPWGEDKYELSFADKKKFLTFLKDTALKSAERKFGKQINDSNLFAKDHKKLQNLITVFKSVTITGWILTILMFILLLNK